MPDSNRTAAGRPRFKAKTREEAENFFLKSLETWREKTGLEKFVLMGHSLGGYLAANYALQHPERVDHLILVCPAAVVSRSSLLLDALCNGKHVMIL